MSRRRLRSKVILRRLSRRSLRLRCMREEAKVEDLISLHEFTVVRRSVEASCDRGLVEETEREGSMATNLAVANIRHLASSLQKIGEWNAMRANHYQSRGGRGGSTTQ
ncbi:hypothetical protein TSUD_26440 [Trifolium subterraneum]|uniref:Uncharacterized protein n=1 Tax=Trifolium subterraneum TaxID=3900 RepID=A0A2Z6N7I2_TRISU|nr:hypothetical protein TSUD_26440 [Trifolium subterraneum]